MYCNIKDGWCCKTDRLRSKINYGSFRKINFSATIFVCPSCYLPVGYTEIFHNHSSQWLQISWLKCFWVKKEMLKFLWQRFGRCWRAGNAKSSNPNQNNAKRRIFLQQLEYVSNEYIHNKNEKAGGFFLMKSIYAVQKRRGIANIISVCRNVKKNS